MVNIALTKGWAIAAKKDAIAKGIQTLATKAATVATGALNAVMMANPYVLVATAVVGLATSYILLRDNTTAAEKATKDYNDKKQQTIESEKAHKQHVDELIETVNNQALADTERSEALNELIKTYPKIFEKYDIETLKLADILKLKKEIANEDSRRSEINKINGYRKAKKDLEEFNKNPQAYLKPLNNAINTGRGMGWLNMFGYQSVTEREQREYLESMLKNHQNDLKKGIKNTALSDWKKNLKTLPENELQKQLQYRQRLIADLQKQEKEGKKWASHGVKFGNEWYSFNKEELQAQSQALKGQIDKLHEQTYNYTDLSKKYAKAVKDAEKALSDITNNKAGYRTESDYKKAISDAKEKLEQAKKEYNDFTVKPSGSSKARATKNTLPDFDTEKAQRDHNRQIQDDLFAREESRIKIMKDGAEKRLAIIQLEYDKQEEEIRRRSEDQLNAFIETEKQKAEAQGKWKKGQAFDTNTPAINAEKARLAENEKVLLASNAEYQRIQQEQVYKDLLEKYQTYTDQRKAIEEKYNADITALQAKLGADAPQVKKAQDEKARELKKLDILYKKEGTAIAKLFENMRKKTVKEIRQTIAEAEAEIDRLASNLDMGDKDNVEYIQSLRQQLEQTRETAERSDTVFGKLGTNIKNLFKAKPNTAEWQEAFNGMLSSAQSITGQFSQLGDEFERLGQSTGNASLREFGKGIKEMGEIVNKAMSFAQIGSSAGPIGGAIGGIIGAVYGFVQKIESDKERARQKERMWKQEQYQNEKRINELYDERILKGEKHSNSLTTNQIGKQLDIIKNYNDKVKKLRNDLIDVQNTQVFDGYRTRWVWQKGPLGIPFWGEEKVEMTKAFKDKIKPFVDELGNIDYDFLEKISKADANLMSFGRDNIDYAGEQIQKAKDLYNQLKEYKKTISEYTSQTFGELGTGFADSILSAVEKGNNAFENFGQTVARVMKNVIKQTLVTEKIKEIFSKFQNDVDNIYASSIGLSNEQVYEKVKNKTVEFVNNIIKPEIQKGEQKAKAMFDALEQSGIKMFDDKNGRNAVEKGFARMSQDSADELNGQFRLLTQIGAESKNAMLQTVKEFTEMHKFLQTFSAQQLKHLSGIELNTYKLHKMESDLAGVKRGIDELTTKGIKIRT